MLPDRVSNPGPLTYESDALPIALRGPVTRFALILYFRIVSHKAACQTLSKAFLKSVKAWYRFC